MGRNRGAATKDLPPNLYLRKGIYYYRDIRDNKEYSVGKNKSIAVTEAIQANLAIFKPRVSLIDRINKVKVVTLHEWLDEYNSILNKRGLREKTLKDYKSKLSIIKSCIDDLDILPYFDCPKIGKTNGYSLDNIFSCINKSTACLDK